jgi:hypothetical protein
MDGDEVELGVSGHPSWFEVIELLPCGDAPIVPLVADEGDDCGHLGGLLRRRGFDCCPTTAYAQHSCSTGGTLLRTGGGCAGVGFEDMHYRKIGEDAR